MNCAIKKYSLSIILVLIISGCSNTPIQSGSHSAPADELLTQADILQNSGNLSGAISQVERILRLEPRNAYAWHKLAKLQLEAGELNKAEQFARRSKQFAAGNKTLLDANQKILDQIKLLRLKKLDRVTIS